MSHLVELAPARTVREGDVVRLPNGADVSVCDIDRYNDGDGGELLVLVYHSNFEWTFENNQRAAKGPRCHIRPVRKSLRPYRPDDVVKVARRT